MIGRFLRGLGWTLVALGILVVLWIGERLFNSDDDGRLLP